MSLINALESSPYWCSTAVFITWDDFGGFFDHVPPPNQPNADVYGPGFRVPLLVVSPYAKKNFVDHTLTDQSSILRFVEDNWLNGARIQAGGSFDTIAGSIENMFQF